ncbi:PREDICTED: C-type lectin domain family 2 member F-like [Chinchilla lanigera]|uniref:C-type lectin domain family 2 member F-like n=1 Tax=Chinchilla lanigera TaxID=34839 RepID=A0A8C2W034_CHILA|nr:PREDICTED: C-type lectin domain family 2 member F-like [Chinchilla lanigera]
MEGEEMENRRKRRVQARRKMIILSVLLCGGLAVLLWVMLKFPKKAGIKRTSNNCTDEMRVCLPDWDLISETCFFQSEHEAIWAEGQKHCRKYYASLAKIVSRTEMESVVSYLNTSTYWIGLRKHPSDNIWRWMDGSHFNNWFTITGSGNCAFISDRGMGISSCNETRRFLCSRRSQCV